MSLLDKLEAFLNLTRMSHGVFLAVAVVVGQMVSQGHLPSLRIFVFSLVTPVFISASAFAANDYMDYETDKKNDRKDRPLVSGALKRSTAFYISILLMPVGVAASYFVNIESFLIALVFAGVSYGYALHLKKVPLLGNLLIAASMAIPFIYGSLNVVETVPGSIWILSAMAFLSGTGREIVKSIQDMEGDREQGRETLPIKIGEKPSSYLAMILTLIAILLTPIPYLYLPIYLGSSIYLVLVSLSVALFLWSIRDAFTGRYASFRRGSLIAIGTGLLAFLAPVL